MHGKSCMLYKGNEVTQDGILFAGFAAGGRACEGRGSRAGGLFGDAEAAAPAPHSTVERQVFSHLAFASQCCCCCCCCCCCASQQCFALLQVQSSFVKQDSSVSLSSPKVQQNIAHGMLLCTLHDREVCCLLLRSTVLCSRALQS